MATLIELDDLRGGYVDLVEYVRENGTQAAPRGQEVRELRNVTVVVRDPALAVPWNVGRKLNPAILAAETVHLIGGLSSAEQMKSVSHVFGNFTNGDKLLGAYGPRTYHQIPLVLRRLVEDPETRQAVATIWQPTELVNPDNKDMPCTVALTWTLRDEKLHMQTFMRSNDVWLGVAYDYGMFTRLQIAMAWALEVAVGEYVHTAVNLHLYERDVKKTYELDRPSDSTGADEIPFAPVPRTWNLRGSDQSLEQVEKRWKLVNAEMAAAVFGIDPELASWPESKWYFDQLRPHAANGLLHMITRYVLPDES